MIISWHSFVLDNQYSIFHFRINIIKEEVSPIYFKLLTKEKNSNLVRSLRYLAKSYGKNVH